MEVQNKHTMLENERNQMAKIGNFEPQPALSKEIFRVFLAQVRAYSSKISTLQT